MNTVKRKNNNGNTEQRGPVLLRMGTDGENQQGYKVMNKGVVKQVGRLYHWIGRHINRGAGYPDTDDDDIDEAEEMLERTTY